ncbi:MAG: flagellar type III secretion system pore protein FliP [Hungatella sp.]
MGNQLMIDVNGNGIPTLEIVVMMTIVALIPSILVMMTSFARIIIILSFTRNAMGIQQVPPNMVMTGLALFLTLFIMSPVIGKVNQEAYIPYKNGTITQQEALNRAQVPMKEFMLKQTEMGSLNLFMELSDIPEGSIQNYEDLPMTTVIPAFMTSEIKRGFLSGFLIFLPFLLIDIIVASTLMSMGMIMLPPATIALPFKIMLFVTVDGWGLLFSSIVKGFN